MKELLNDLNPQQQEAVLTTEGPVLILAGPGSGKTKTLTQRIAHLLQIGVPAEEILAVTFTNKAAGEMRSRIRALVGEKALNANSETMFVGTFHSLAVKILRVHASRLGFLPNFTIFDDDDSLALIKETMKELAINPKQFPAGMISGVISGLKNELVTPGEYEAREGLSDLFPKTVHKIYAFYQKSLHDANAMDFDDLIMNVCLLFDKNPVILESYQNRFRYINVDEYQDVNQAQYRLVTQLALKKRNIAVVGDDAQAIYAFRGADYRNILNFENDWPDAKVVVLDQNYRSTQIILEAASELIAKNKLQKKKQLWTTGAEGEPITVVAAENERQEAEFILSLMKDLVGRGCPLKDMVVLYRTNAQSRNLEEVFLEHNFPYKIVGGIKFYHRKEVKDVISYLRFLFNSKDLVSLKRIINVPARGIGKSTILAYLAENKRVLRPAEKEKIERFHALKTELREGINSLTAAAFLKHLLKTIKYREYLDDSSANSEERWENVQELVSLAKKYDALESPKGLEKLLEDVALMSDSDQIETGQSVVNLMTLHSAKGLEFPVVFVVGMEEGIFPHSRSLFNPADLEEERRLCYVGLTRAKKRVFLSFALQRTRFGATEVNPPSRFLSEIPEHLLEVNELIPTIEAKPL
ncbi:MAG: UvrD-helicase domain-containing protein [Candidatus Sungiibacteriota bacterium]|uniref:DNA 3'-5' helicase n=1 Tax=Candidatus Sungiibacteriota bacterium TaxID=2750080 RepID=A0A7T5URQ4_9BACT|nr:MAG: UvrD-helicase domain-containing protein [Candidatus Sungbacteria bacterium]